MQESTPLYVAYCTSSEPFRFLPEPHLGDLKHNSHTPKPGEQVLYMLFHHEDINKDFVSGNQVFYLPFYCIHVANICIPSQVMCDDYS